MLNFISVEYGAVPDDGQNDYNAIHQAVIDTRGLSGLTIIYFPPGTYDVYSEIELTYLDNNIVFQGAGSNQTTLKFTVGSNKKCFKIHGYQTSTLIYLSTGVPKGSKDLYGNNINSLQVGDWIRLSEYHHGIHDSWAYGSIGQITQLVNIQGNHAITKDEASKYYSYANGTRFWKIVPVQNIGIEKLKIYRNDSGHTDDGTNIYYEYAVNCWVKGAESEYTSRNHIDIKYSSHVEVSGCYFHHARNYGGGGRAYGVTLQFSTTNCLIENNIFKHLRHAMVVQAGANSNVFGYNYSFDQVWTCDGGCPNGWGSDITIHGNYPYANLFEGNSVHFIFADGVHGNNGPYNTFFRNHTHDEKESYLWNCDYANFVANSNSNGLDLDLDEAHELIVGFFQGWSVSPSQNVIDKYINFYPNGYPWNSWYSLTHGQWAYFINDGFWGPHFVTHSFLNEYSYYHTSEPDFLNGYEWPPLGPYTNFDMDPYVNALPDDWIIPAQVRYNNSNKTYILNPIQWPPQPVAVTITGPTHLNQGQTGEFTANPSGGSGSYTNYKWWYRNDEGVIVPYGLSGGIEPNAPPPGEWIYMSYKEGQQTITMGPSFDFSLKCEVTDSDNNTATDIHSVIVGGPSLSKEQQNNSATLTMVPTELTFAGNYPNPFNPTTTIRFGLPEAQQVSIKIYSITGAIVKTLVDDYLSEGYHQVVWNGFNQSGNKVASGIYIYEMRTKDKRFIKKMLLAK